MHSDGVNLLKQARQTAVELRQTAFLQIVASPDQEATQLEVLPLLWLDVGGRTDIGDIWRVHAQEGSGDVVTCWIYDLFDPTQTPTCFLFCELRSPVRASFFVAFPLPRYEELLRTIAGCRRIALLTGMPPASLSRFDPTKPHTCEMATLQELLREGFIIELYHEELSLFLGQWRHAEAQ